MEKIEYIIVSKMLNGGKSANKEFQNFLNQYGDIGWELHEYGMVPVQGKTMDANGQPIGNIEVTGMFKRRIDLEKIELHIDPDTEITEALKGK